MKKLPVDIAIIDDDPEMLRVLSRFLQKQGIVADLFDDPRKAITAFLSKPYGVVVSDVQMPGLSGIEMLEHVGGAFPTAVVVMITGFGSVSSAVEAMKLGAFDYLSKPFELDEFLVVLNKAVEQHRLKAELGELRRSIRARDGFGEMIGRSPGMRRVFDVVRRVATTDTHVLIIGESGSGKEVVARAIHESGRRKDAPFVALNCGALPEMLLESELFGHERGAYTGAVSREHGLLASADAGTIFLDEIADMPTTMQAKLLRVLEDWEVRPVGGSESRTIDVRVISSSKYDLLKAVQEGTFREDLFYRLNVVTIEIPALRERMEDVPLLTERILARLAEEQGRTPPVVEREVMELLLRYPWPGNVRELEHLLERAMVLSPAAPVITVEDLPPGFAKSVEMTAVAAEEQGLPTLREMERMHIMKALDISRWNRSTAAEMLGINRRTLYRKIRDYGIDKQ